MKKNKELNVWIRILKNVARVLILNIPAVIILLGLMAANKLSWISAGISLLAFWGISAIIVIYVFKDLDNFMTYLKKLAQGFEPELPKLHWGIFSSMRLTNTFLSVKNLWSNQFLSDKSVLENLTNPLILLDTNKTIVFANLSACNSFQSPLVKQKIQSLSKENSFLTAIDNTLKGSLQTTTLNDWLFKNTAGQTLAFQVKINLLPAPMQNGAILALSFFDITPFKLFKEQQADFFANASHELKTPLAIISGCVETLQTSAKDDPKASEQFLSLIAEQSTRMTTLIQKMLQLSKMQIDVPLSKEKTFSVNDLLQKVIRDLAVRSQTLQKEIVLQKHPHLPLLAANRDELYHVFINLLDNALKYSAPNSIITVRTYFDSAEKNQLVVSVHNEGTPIPAEKLGRIWDKFYRVTETENAPEGSGLGLSIVHQLVQKYHGTIDVSSTSETGTTFTVYFPV